MKFDVMDVEENDCKRSRAMDIVLKKRSNETRSRESSGGSSPISPTSVLPELPDKSNYDHFEGFAVQSYAVNHTVPFKLQAVGKLNPIEVEQFPFNVPSLPVEDKYTLHWLKKTAAEEPPADKKVKLDLEVALEQTSKNRSDMLDVDGEGSNLTRLKLQAAKQWLGKSMSQPELSNLASSALPLKFPSKPKTQISALPSPPLELPSTESTLPMLPAPESPNPSAVQPLLPISPHQLVSLPSPSFTTVQPLPPPAPPLMSMSMIPSILKGPPPPPPPPSYLKGPLPLPSSPKGPPPPPPPSTLKGPPPSPPPSNLRGPPLPPPMIPSKGSPPLPPMPPTIGAPLPPPPSLGGRTLGPKAATKLKRSSQMGNLYRLLKVKIEGSSLNGKSTQGRKSQVGSSANGKQGMADALLTLPHARCPIIRGTPCSLVDSSSSLLNTSKLHILRFKQLDPSDHQQLIVILVRFAPMISRRLC